MLVFFNHAFEIKNLNTSSMLKNIMQYRYSLQPKLLSVLQV